MKTQKTASLAVLSLFLVSGFVVSCTKKEAAPEAAPAAAAPAAEAAAAPAQPKATPDVEIVLGTDGDQMAFDKKELEVKAGATVKVTFKNNAKAGGLQHNWLLVKPGTEMDVANAAVAAGNDKGWVPQDNASVLVASKLVDPQGSDSVVFVAPPAGDYPYICTFPGHAMVMKGVMHSK